MPRPPGQLTSLAARLAAPPGVIVTHYRGLSAAELAELRRALAGHAHYQVTKNTLARLAGGVPLSFLLDGPTALAFVDRDMAEAAAVLAQFADGHPALVVRGAVLDGTLLTPGALARLEPRRALLARLDGGMRTVASQAARLALALAERKTDGEAEQR